MRWQRTLSRWNRPFALGLSALLAGSAAAQAPNGPAYTSYAGLSSPAAPSQAEPGLIDRLLHRPTGPNPIVRVQNVQSPTETQTEPTESGSRLEELSTTDTPVGAERAPALGPTPPQDVKLIMDNTALGDYLKERGTRVYGWMNMGYTASTVGSGIMNVEPRENRFGDQFIVNQMAIDLEHPLKTDELSFGYNALFYAGADAALLRPRGGFTTTDPRFGVDFRELYASAHLPVLSEGGVDVKAGRQGTIIGYESAMAPYRPFYSNDYQWFYTEDGAWTGVLTNWHVNKQLDVLNGVTLGANTFFTLRGNGPCYIGQVNYWTTEAKKTLLTVSAHVGNQAIFTAPGFVPGNVVSVLELRLQHNWNEHLTTVLQSNDAWQTSMPGVGTGEAYSLYNITIWHVNKVLDLNNRESWFHDVEGVYTGVATNYGAVTLGADYHPRPWFRLRPELRGDFASAPAFGIGGPFHHSQMTAAIETLFQY